MKEVSPKTLWSLIFVVGCFGIGLGIFQLSRSLKSPFAGLTESPSDSVNARKEILALRDKDTDNDTLSDFDELKIHRTSPYLADSDSDGISDNTELANGTDPNCPQGKSCTIAVTNTNGYSNLANLYNINQNTNVNAGENTNQQTNTNSNQNGNTNTTGNSNTNPAPEDVSISALRDALKGAGVPAETLNALSDVELRQLYAEALSQESTNSNTNLPVTNNTNASNLNETDQQTLAQLSQLTPAEIRELMIASGVPAETLSQIDDATLKAIFLESINGVNQ
ncbi:MAG: thrombospondin type 3 repeat-containing protein [Patescibacteria group bacterium]